MYKLGSVVCKCNREHGNQKQDSQSLPAGPVSQSSHTVSYGELQVTRFPEFASQADSLAPWWAPGQREIVSESDVEGLEAWLSG